MKLKEKVDYIINKLEEIYPVLNIPLDHKDPYTLLIAVLMSAQSTDKKVNEITPKILIDKYHGEVPNDIQKLEELPSVGHKTASVVVSQGFGQPAFPVDTHIHRLMYRWGLSTGKNVIKTELDAKRLFPKSKWNELHLRIIFYGREYCPARGWDINNDIITKTIGRKSVINKLIK